MTEAVQKIELLAPAKDAQTGIAAIKCGADAVYIGAARFGARQDAGNTLEDIKKLIDFAHPYYVKVYAALNTILNDHELIEAEKIIGRLYQSGIDGLIIQDVGLLELDLPPLAIIASTQMHTDTAEKVKFLEEVGFSRVILPRELTLEQIHQIRRQTSIELECFVQGALCVAESGQCYMSYAMGGRSGNRGECAQPCRKLYSLKDNSGKTICKDRYLLSLKDLNLSGTISELLDAGITSFKIEGRLKNPVYVANLTAYYRNLLDSILPEKKLQKSSSGLADIDFVPNPSKTFNRGFTDYGIKGRYDKMGSIDTPKSIGEMIGKVGKVTSDYFEVESDLELHNADGICFFDNDHNLQGTVLNQVEGKKIFPQKIKGLVAGRLIYRNHDHAFDQRIGKIPADRKISLRMKFYETAEGVALAGTDEDGNCATVKINHKKEPAKKLEMARQNISTQLNKLGNTIFYCNQIEIDLAEIYFFPVSVLNNLKRDLVKAMLESRLTNRRIPKNSIKKNKAPYPQQRLGYTGNVFNDKARMFYQRHGVDDIARAGEEGLDFVGKQVARTKYCIRGQLDLCTKHKKDGVAEPLILVDQEGHHFRLEFRCDNCSMDIYLESKGKRR
ncbi:MAG: U32 family peptidase [Phycisphaerae bacterium]|nr:U32 family peptidase [Phycisphaerae bacterium]